MISTGSQLRITDDPYRHVSAPSVFSSDTANAALAWLERDASWKLRIADFYEQWEVHVQDALLPDEVKALCSDETIAKMIEDIIAPLSFGQPVTLTEVTAHKLLAKQTIRIHNDFLDGDEHYRLLVQLNRGWIDAQGGMLMLFASGCSTDVRRVLRPVHGSIFAFEISPASYHAVSTVHSGERYTLVYSFKDACHEGA